MSIYSATFYHFVSKQCCIYNMYKTLIYLGNILYLGDTNDKNKHRK